MSVTITIPVPDEFASTLQAKAKQRRLPLPELVLDLLTRALAGEQEAAYPTLEEVVEEIRNLPRNPANFQPATGSLAEALANAPNEPPIDEDAWMREWMAVEMEMKAITRANDLAEGRGW